MMGENGQPEAKRPRYEETWNEVPGRPQLPPPLATNVNPPPQPPPAYNSQQPYSRPEAPRPPILAPISSHFNDTRRASAHAEQIPHEIGRPVSRPGTSHGYQHSPTTQLPPMQMRGSQDGMGIKTDPSTPTQGYQPTSAGGVAGQEHLMNTAQLERQYNHHGLPPGAPYPPQNFPPPSPGAIQVGDYGAAPMYAPRSGSEHFGSVSYPAAGANTVKRKAQRAAQACDSCRSLKAKCDEGRPVCQTCKEKGITCIYRDPPPKAQDKTQTDIMDGIHRLEAMMGTFSQRFDRVERDIDGLKRGAFTSHSAGANMKKEEFLGSPSLNQYHSPHRHGSPIETVPSASPVSAEIDAVDEADEERGNPPPPGEPAIPVNHTTGAARLLNVPAIRNLVTDLLGSKYIKDEKYTMRQEERRGLLRLYGRGEGIDRPPGYDKQPALESLGGSTPSDTASEPSSPQNTGEEWGQVGGLTPASSGDEQPLPLVGKHEISSEGMPDFSPRTVTELTDSYNKHMNRLHPILVPTRLNQLVSNFLKSIPESHAKTNIVSRSMATFVGIGSNSQHPESPGQKRKRSPGSNSETTAEGSISSDHKPGHPYRSISTALVLLVLAIGKICQHEGKLPEPLALKEQDVYGSGNSPKLRNGLQSPIQPSPVMAPPGVLPSLQDTSLPRSRRASTEGVFVPKNSLRSRNLDVVPGLAYFSMATDIIGNQLGGLTLQHVHANILAGLYHGQLGRVLESWSYLANACRLLQVLLSPRMERLTELKKNLTPIPSKDNPWVFAFWTCLQLESDIVAELDVPHSGILNYEEQMPEPNYTAAKEEDKLDNGVVESYAAQLYLRRHLNSLHKMFYKPGSDELVSNASYIKTVDIMMENLGALRVVTPTMHWDKATGQLATDILGARLRAKYYGAEVITFRRFVMDILRKDSLLASQGGKASDEVAKVAAGTIALNAKAIEDVDEKVREYAQRCITALINSTKAFHGLGPPGTKRLIVTNIFGTAHAQWGNCMTLLAAYKNPILGSLIEKQELHDLVLKTLAFLKCEAQKSSSLHIDRKLLKEAGINAGLLKGSSHPDVYQSPDMTSSFSSNPGDVQMTG